MHERESAAWLARLHHLLVVERLGHSRVRLAGGVPIAAKTRTLRHLARQDPAAIDALERAWPDIQRLPNWPDLKATFDRMRRAPAPAPMTRRGYVQGPSGEQPLPRLAELLRRLAYLHDEEELSGDTLGSITASESWRVMMFELPKPLGAAMVLYLDAAPTQRVLLRLFLRTRRVLDDAWRSLDEAAVLAAFADALAREPSLVAELGAESLERLARAGVLAPASRSARDPDGPLAPLERVPSSHFDCGQEPALLTMSSLI